jgi:uncharacterized protein (TIGR02722 family)
MLVQSEEESNIVIRIRRIVMKRILITTLLCVVVAFSFTGCGKQVKRVETDTTIDLSGRWNDTDSRLVSEEMIQDAMNRPWHDDFSSRSGGKKPVVIVGTVRNRSTEHINTQTFTKDLERALINSGEADFVASRVERQEIREERKDQAVYSSEETAKEHGRELGADYMLQGSINSIEDKEGGKKVVFYQVDLELIDLETNRKVWIGDKKIKKYVKKSAFGL